MIDGWRIGRRVRGKGHGYGALKMVHLEVRMNGEVLRIRFGFKAGQYRC